MSFSKAQHNDFIGKYIQTIVEKDEGWTKTFKPVMWIQIASYIDTELTNVHSGQKLQWQFDVYYDIGYGYFMVIVDGDTDNAQVYQSTAFCECFEYANYCITFQEQSDRTTFYKKVGV